MSFKQYIKFRVKSIIKIIKKYSNAFVWMPAVLIVGIGGFLLLSKQTDNQTHASAQVGVNSTVGTTINNLDNINPQSSDVEAKWRKSVDISDSSLSIDGSVTEMIDENQVLTGNLFLPEGWSAEYSTDARNTQANDRTFTSYDMVNQANNPLADITFLKILTKDVDSLKPQVSAPLIRPMEVQQFITDGKTPSSPILFDQKIFVIMLGEKAAIAGSYSIDCFDLITYSRCKNHDGSQLFPTYLSSTDASATAPTNLGTGIKNISTPTNIQPVMDDGTYGHNGRLYLPAQSGNDYGVACVDLATYQNCGFTVLGTANAPAGPNPSWLVGFAQNGSKIYGHANDSDKTLQTVVCFDIRDPANGGGICSGYDANTLAITRVQDKAEHYYNYETPGTQIIDNDKMYWVVNYRYRNTRLVGVYPDSQRDFGTVFTCWDTVTTAPCTGIYTYNQPRVYDGSSGDLGKAYTGPLFPWKQNGATTAICYINHNVLINDSVTKSRVRCHDPNTGALFPNGDPLPGILPSPQTWQGQTLPDSPAWRLASNPLTVTGDDGNSKTYFAWQYGKEALRGAMSCFDWNTQDYCAGIPQVRYWYHINEAESADMGYAYDGSCMIGVSKQGYLWSFNPNTGETPCRVARTKFTATFNMANYYCDGQNHAFNWQNAHLAKSSMFDFQKFNVRVLDQPDGQEQAYSDIKQNTLDLSALSPGQFGSLFFDVDTVIWSSSPWSGSTYGPRVAVQADADNVQYCFTTRPKTVVEGMACDVSKLTTISSAVFKTTSDTLSSTDPSHINYQQPSNVQCFKDLSVSITPDRSTVGNDQLVTYAITINNKANADPQNRGQVQGAQFEFELPSGMTFESATNGGSLQGNKVVWANQTVEPGQQQNLSVSIRTPQASVDGQNSSQFAVLASAIFEDDTYQDDNSATSSQVNFIDNAAPVISNLTQSFANPRQPATLNFSVHVTDDVSVHDVELLKDGVSLGQMAVGGSPGQYTMLFTDQVAGTYQYTVRATDNASPQAVTISSPLIISIGDPNVAPQILNFEKTSGQDGIKAPGSVSFLARVEDDYSNPSVKLYRNNEVVSTLTKINSGLPNNNNYSATVNALAQGTHEFKLVVTDGEDSLMVVESSVISVTVLPANTAPVISNISQTSSSLIAPATITMVATVTDDYGLSKVELLGNSHEVVGQMQATGVANQYSITLTNQQAGNYVFKIKAIDNDQHPMATFSSPYNVQVVSPPTPPTPPTPTPPTPSPTASNQPPIVVGLSQKIVQPTAPAKLEFEVYAADDKGVSSVELLKGSDNLGNMTSIGDGYYSLTLNNYSAGSYSFRVKVTDNGNPALSVLSADIVVDVRPEQAVQQNTQPSNSTSDSNNNSGTDSQNTKQPSNNDGNRTSYIDNTGRKISYRGDVEQRLTPLAMREAVPQMLVGTVESAFKIADKVVSPVSPSTAKILPYTTLTIIAILGLSYAVLAFKQAIVRRQISELVARFKKTEENRRNYLDLIAHYLNTPVAKMQMALELLQGKKDVPEKLLVSAESRIKRLHNHVNSLLLNSQSTNTVSVDAARSIEITNKSWLVTNLGFILPAAGAIVITIILNALFVWSKKYDTHILNVIIQTGVGVASVIGLGAGFNYFRTQKEALLAAQKELDLERSVAESQTQFIQASGTHLAEDMSQIQTIASVVSKTKAGAVFNDGMTTLGRAVDKLSYLNEITSQTTDSVNDPIQIDILTRQTVEKFTKMAKDKGVELDVSVEPNIRVNVDSRGFTQILQSTLDNAIKFTSKGGKVGLDIKSKGGKVVVRVKDDGAGIPKQRLETLFKPFARGTDILQFDFEGLGIDLYMDKIIAERWGGDIAIKSVEGKGTDVEVTLIGARIGV